ncbi:unnamed protein product [Calypogeia fissa]
MTTLLGATSCASSSIPSARLVFSSTPARLSSSSLTPSSFWGNSCSCSGRKSVPTLASDLSLATRPSSLVTSATLKSDVSKISSISVKTTAREARVSASGMSSMAAEGAVVASEEPSTSYNSSGVNVADVKAWKARRAARKTTRRRALAVCLALAGLTRHGPSLSTRVEQEHQSPDSQTYSRDLIRLSQSSATEMPVKMISPVSGERYGDLVTVSTGSSDSLNNGKVRGLPSWMRGNYNLCMGDGFHVQLPSDWHMHDTQGRLYGTILRYEDKRDPTTNVVVLRSPTSKSRTGKKPEDWIREQAYLLSGSNEPIQFQSGDDGKDAGRKFPGGKISIAKVLSADKPKYKQGLTYYNYEILTKQGGGQKDALHQLVSAVVNNGNLYMCRVQTDEGRWQGDLRSMAQLIVDSFQITGFKINV